MAKGIGDEFQQSTKYQRDRMTGGGLDWASQPEVYKEYPNAQVVALPEPAQPAVSDISAVFKTRRSVRDFADEPLDTARLSYLLWASTGITRRDDGYEFRTAPSAGALYPIETYLVVNHASDLVRGVYHYAVRRHALELLREGDFRKDVTAAALGQEMCYHAPVVWVWTAVFERSKWKYKQRAYRYVYLDAGHVAAQFSLAAVACGLGTCQIGALFDDDANAVVGVDGIEESVLYMSVVGTSRR